MLAQPGAIVGGGGIEAVVGHVPGCAVGVDELVAAQRDGDVGDSDARKSDIP